MPAIRIVRRSALPPAEAFRRLTDWERHGAQVPLTKTVVDTAPPTGVGTRFTARTGVGRLTLDDRMEIVRWQPPAPDRRTALVRLEKRGRAVRGWAEIEIAALPAGGSEIRWREDLRLTGLPRFLDPTVAAVGHLLFSRALDRLLADRHA
ncbi:SRPBCC family protein [Streptomyces sp. NPDC002054]|uniref:SRPBCC family protein n=1 Tax=Streptomyces sp. NPDC002054 TaxID=3154663 RepID=UPI00331F6BE4